MRSLRAAGMMSEMYIVQLYNMYFCLDFFLQKKRARFCFDIITIINFPPMNEMCCRFNDIQAAMAVFIINFLH